MSAAAKELRLGLVCYGGSSLAIYMHGVTREIHRLVKASAISAAGATPISPSEQFYSALLDELMTTGTPNAGPLRVIVDVIAGTSAGGINGIYLAKALVGNLSLGALRSLWFSRADMDELVVGPRRLGPIIPIHVNAGPIRIDRTIRPPRISWKAKAPFLGWRSRKQSPLRGDDMSRWLYEALVDMDATSKEPPSVRSLLPPAHPLDLFVTITDFYGYQRLILLSRPRFVTDLTYRHALTFHHGPPGSSDFADNPGLAFAARTTSCFPGVFPPVRPAEFGLAIRAPLATIVNRCFRIYALSGADPNGTYFIDGGVLDNKPFGWAIDTIIRKRPAESEVDRRLVYIEPDPSTPRQRQGGPQPKTLTAALGALSSIPRAEPILDELLGIQGHNELVARIRDVVEANFGRVASLILSIDPFDDIVRDMPPAEWPWSEWNDKVHMNSIEKAGMTYATYLRLKISSVLDGLAGAICSVCNYPDESNQAFLIREAVRAWGRKAGFFEGVAREVDGKPCPEGGEAFDVPPFRPTDGQIHFLQSFDLGYMRRRLRFLVAALNWWYRCVDAPSFPRRADLDDAKTTIYRAIGTLDTLAVLRVGVDADENVQQEAAAVRERIATEFAEDRLKIFLEDFDADGARYASERKVEMNEVFDMTQALLRAQLAGFAPSLLGEIVEQTSAWDRRRVRDLVVRYLGFPIWDVLLYPVQALSQIGEGDEIKVVRVSPRDADILPLPTERKVEGARLGHFYAFFSREARENDYLWGRLDAAEQLIRLLFDATANASVGPQLVSACKRGFAAVLDEEAGEMTSIQGTVDALRVEIGSL
jgi:patatin-related protein